MVRGVHAHIPDEHELTDRTHGTDDAALHEAHALLRGELHRDKAVSVPSERSGDASRPWPATSTQSTRALASVDRITMVDAPSFSSD